MCPLLEAFAQQPRLVLAGALLAITFFPLLAAALAIADAYY